LEGFKIHRVQNILCENGRIKPAQEMRNLQIIFAILTIFHLTIFFVRRNIQLAAFYL
jgi:hypothetical protein